MRKSRTKYSIQDARSIVKSYGYKPLFDEYRTIKDKLLIENKQGYLGLATLNCLRNGQSVAWFHKSNPYTIQNVHTFLKQNKCNIDILSTEWVSANSGLTFKCNVCQRSFNMQWDSMRSHKPTMCYNCSQKQITDTRRNSVEYIKSRFEEYGYVPLFSRYTSNKEKLPVMDSGGYKGILSYHQLTYGSGFAIFHRCNPFTIDNIKHYIKVNCLSCKYHSGAYTSASAELFFVCECGEHFSTVWTTVMKQGKVRCGRCANSESKFEYTIRRWLTERNYLFEKQYTFSECVNKKQLRFDFAVFLPERLALVEVNGVQHYKVVDYFGGKEGFKSLQENYEIKRKYCEDNKIELIEIPYWYINNGKYKDLLERKFSL